jgi:hypothetical protein
VITVLDPAGARRALAGRLLRCPKSGCDGVLRIWSPARPRTVARADGSRVTLRPDRARCRVCAVTHVLLPVWCVPRRGYDVDVIGAALLGAAEGAGHRKVAAQVGVPAGTVRGWLRSVSAGSTALIANAATYTGAAGVDLLPAQAPPIWTGRPLAEAVSACGVAARAFFSYLAFPPRPGPGGYLTGIDYLATLAARHRAHLCRVLTVADPTAMITTLTGWPMINLITRGRLLTSGPAG